MTRYPYYKYAAYPIYEAIANEATQPVFVKNFESPKRQTKRILKDLTDRFGLPARKPRREWRVRQTKTAIWLIGPARLTLFGRRAQVIVLQKIFTNKL